jgi:sugar phosphate isomerase/epimerase
MAFSRRKFSKALLSNLPLAMGAFSLLKPGLLAAFAPVDAFAAPTGAPPLGLNTWSLRALKHDQAIPTILRVMQETGMRNCQLLFSHAEPEEFDPDFASMFSAAAKPPTAQQREEQKRKSEARAAWRLSVPMTYFEALRAQFEQRGLTIRAYATPLGSSAEEIDRVFLMAKTMGAAVVITRLSEAQTDLVAAAALRHGLLVGIQFSDQRILEQQLRASSRLRADPDTGDLTKAGVSALEFIKKHLDSISSIDLKDAMTGGGSVPFGTGDAHMKQVLEFLVSVHSQVELYIDCDYPGTGSSTDEVKRCVRYVREVIGE